MDQHSIHEQLADFAAGLPITDCCEHHRPVTDATRGGLAAWLASTHLGRTWTQPASDEWPALARWLADASTTRAYRWLLEAMRRVLSFGTEINESNFQRISAKLNALMTDPAATARLAMETVRIERVLLDAYWNPFDPNIRWDSLGYRPLLNVDPFLRPRDSACEKYLDLWKRRMNLRTGEFDEYLHFVASAILESRDLGTVGLTCRLGRRRPLPTGVCSRQRAAELYEGQDPPDPAGIVELESYLFWHVLHQAEFVGLSVMIEVGEMPSAGCHVLQLMPTLERFKQVRFGLLGGGYPWCRETVALGRQFTNLYVDLGRIAMISPEAARQFLGEWIDLVPGGTKRLTFSGTSATLLETYAARLATEDLLADVLSNRVADCLLPMSAAIEAVQSTMHDCGLRFYGINTADRLPTLR